MTIATPIEKWSGKVREIALGATAAQGGSRSHTVTVGGESTLPFLHFEGQMPHPPLVALEVRAAGPRTGRPCCWRPGAPSRTIPPPGPRPPKRPGPT